MRFNEPACRERLAEAYDRCIHGEAKTVEEKSAAVIAKLEGIVKQMCIRDRVSAVIRGHLLPCAW